MCQLLPTHKQFASPRLKMPAIPPEKMKTVSRDPDWTFLTRLRPAVLPSLPVAGETSDSFFYCNDSKRNLVNPRTRIKNSVVHFPERDTRKIRADRPITVDWVAVEQATRIWREPIRYPEAGTPLRKARQNCPRNLPIVLFDQDVANSLKSFGTAVPRVSSNQSGTLNVHLVESRKAPYGSSRMLGNL